MTRRKRKRTPRKRQEEYPGWLWMLFGLAIGLSVAFAIYMRDQNASLTMQAAAPQPASMAPVIHKPRMISEILFIPAFSILNSTTGQRDPISIIPPQKLQHNDFG